MTIDQLFADTSRVEELSPVAFSRGLAAIERALAQSELTHSSAQSLTRPVRPRSRRRGIAITAAGIAVVAGVIALPVVSFDGRHTDNAAAAVLHQAATASASQPGAWQNAPYWHVASTYQRDGETFQRDIWVAHNGQGVLHDTGLPAVLNPGRPGPDLGFISLSPFDFIVGDGSVSWDGLYALPTDPGALASVLRTYTDASGPQQSAEMFAAVADLLRESPAPPALREALYRVAAALPGVQSSGRVADAAGRVGTAVSLGTETLVVDTSNGQLLADLDSVSYTYLDQGPTDTAPALTSH